MSTNRGLGIGSRTVILLSLITLLSKLMGFVRDQLVASRFGVSATSDALISAQLLPTMMDAIVAASITTVLIPVVTSARTRSKKELSSVLITSSTIVGIILVTEAVVLWVTAPAVMKGLVPGFNEVAMTKAVLLARIFAPSVALLGFAAFLTAISNVDGSFMLPAASTLCANGSIIVVAILHWNDITAEHLAWAVVTGNVLQVIILWFHVKRRRLVVGSAQFQWSTVGYSTALVAPMLLANLIVQLTPLGEKFFASHLTEGSVAALNYALKLIQLPHGVIVAGLSAVLFANFSRLAVAGQYDLMADYLGRALRGLLFVMVPIVGLAITLAVPLVTIAFRRGEFDGRAVAVTVSALRAYAVGLLPMASWPVVTRVLHALGNTRTHLLAGALGTAAYVIAAVILGPGLMQRGLAYAFVIGQYTSFLVVSVEIARRLGADAFRVAARALPVNLFATLLCTVIAWATSQISNGVVFQFLAGTIVGGCVYLAVHFLCHSQESEQLTSVVRRVLTRVKDYRLSGQV